VLFDEKLRIVKVFIKGEEIELSTHWAFWR